LAGAAITGALSAFPKELIAAMARVGSAFWGVIAGALALLVQRAGKSHFGLPPR